MARLRVNATFGTLTDSLSDSDTTATNDGFVDLPVVEAPDIAVLVFDPDEMTGDAEIVYVTAHADGSDTIEFTRGQEDTTARSHPVGCNWLHGPTAKDFELTDLVTVTGTTEVTVGADLVLAGAPTGANQAATKGYVDSIAAGQRFKESCRVATTANITIATALNDGDVIDDVTLEDGDRVLVKDQTVQAQNGIYVVGSSPARATDADETAELDSAAVFVIYGTANAGTSWVQTTDSPVVGTDAVVWAQTGGGRTLADDETLVKVGSTMSIKDSGVTIGKISGSTEATAAQYLNGTGGWTTPAAAGLDWTIVASTTLAGLQAARGTVAGGATGRYIYVPAGTYQLTAVLALNVPGQTWVFHPQAIITRATSADPASILSIQSTDIRISGGIVDGGDSRTLPRSGRTTETKTVGGQTVAFSGINAVVLTSAAARVTIENMTIRNAYNSAVSSSSASSVRLQNLYILNSGGTAINGTANVADVEGLVVQGCLIDRTGFTGNASYYGGGVKLMGDQDEPPDDTHINRGMRIIGNDIRQPYLNFSDGDGAGGNECVVYQEPLSRNGLVANNVCVGGSIGISFSKNYGATIIGNTVYGFAKLGLEISNADFCTVTGNIVDGGMAETRVSACTKYHNGIAVWTGAADTTVVGNTVRNLRSATNAYGILVQQDDGMDAHVTVSGNVISVRENATGIFANKMFGTTIIGNQIRCDESGTTTGTTGIGLGIDNTDAGITGRFVVAHNQVRAAAVAIATSGTGTLKDTLITHNVLYDDCDNEYTKAGGVTLGARLVWADNVGSADAAARTDLT